MYSLILKLRNLVTNPDDKTILYNTVGAFIIKGSGLFVSLFTMPAYINYFENQQILGIWFTLLSILNWILTFDLGIGNGLRNSLVPVFIEENYIKAKKLISSAYIMSAGVAILAILISLIIFNFIDWNTFFNISHELISNSKLRTTVTIIFAGIMVQFVLKLITSVLYSLQQSAIANSLSLISTIINLIYVTSYSPKGLDARLISMSLVHILSVNLPLLIVTFVVFNGPLHKSRPNFHFYEKSNASRLMKVGGLFFLVQCMYMILTTTNEFLITWLSGPQYVVEYQVYNKIFTIMGTLFVLVLTPIWSAVTKAHAKKDYRWILKIYRIISILACGATVFQLMIVPFLQEILSVWIGEDIVTINYSYVTVFLFSGTVLIWNSVLSTIANGLGHLKIQALIFSVGAILKIPLSIFLVSNTGTWIGIIISNVLLLGIYCVIQGISLNKFLKDNAKLTV